jgi:hypothetical protein
MSGRREFIGGVIAGTIAVSVARAQLTRGQTVLREAMSLGRRLRRGELTQVEWQDAIVATLASCSVEELGEAAGRSSASNGAPPVSRGAVVVRAPAFSDLGADEGADLKLFFFEAGRSDPPHVHFNLVAAHIVLAGEFRVRHFERLEERSGGFVLRPSHDRIIGPGQVTTISDLRDNGHWHQARTRGVLLDVQQGRIDPALPVRRRVTIDPDRARSLGDGTLLVRQIENAEALRRYG